MRFFITILLFTIFANAQETEIASENYFWSYNNIENTDAVIGVKNCYVRTKPSANSVLLDSLQAGKQIVMVKNSAESLNIKGLNLQWVEIEYYQNNQLKKGFLWKGFAAISSVKEGNLTFLTTVDRKFIKKEIFNNEVAEITTFGFTTKVLDENNQLICEKQFTAQPSESYDNYGNVIGGWGLQNIQKIYRLGIGGGGCAIPTNYTYLGFTGSELLVLPAKYEVGDANAYYENQNFIFPKEKGGLPNTIIKEIIVAENTDESLETSNFLVNKTIEYYNWDGKNFKLIKTKKLKPYKEKM